jgi:ferredoxin, 2Fe-2S
MIKLNVIDRKGEKTILDVQEDTTIRDAISNAMTPNNFGNCGGDCICGSCQVHVSAADFSKLLPPDEEESGTLESMSIKPVANSRLGCQVKLTKDHDNITVTIAPE